MSDITEAPIQEAIADSILSDDNIVGSWKDGALSEKPAAEPQENAERLADLATDRREEPMSPEDAQRFAESIAKPGERVGREGERQESEPALAQTQAPTQQSVQEWIQSTESLIRENSLNDPQAAREFANGLCETFGTDLYASGANVEALGMVAARTAISALNVYEAYKDNPASLGPIPAESAQAFTHEFLRAWGVDPRAVQVNPQMLAETVLRGALNLIDTHQRFGGKIAHLDQLNSPEAAESFLANFLAAFGIESRPDRATALKFADANAKFLLSFMTKVGQLQPQGRTRGARSSQRRARGEWRTNSDLFDGAQDMLDQEATGKRGREGFEPRQRASRSPFQTNRDIFDEETLSAFNGRL